eukprot:1159741-Pelagomonas_calceolata.AAC.18
MDVWDGLQDGNPQAGIPNVNDVPGMLQARGWLPILALTANRRYPTACILESILLGGILKQKCTPEGKVSEVRAGGKSMQVIALVAMAALALIQDDGGRRAGMSGHTHVELFRGAGVGEVTKLQHVRARQLQLQLPHDCIYGQLLQLGLQAGQAAEVCLGCQVVSVEKLKRKGCPFGALTRAGMQMQQHFRSTKCLGQALGRWRCFSAAAGEATSVQHEGSTGPQHHLITSLSTTRAVIRIEGDQGPQFLQVGSALTNRFPQNPVSHQHL